jgi:hypothetical protein
MDSKGAESSKGMTSSSATMMGVETGMVGFMKKGEGRGLLIGEEELDSSIGNVEMPGDRWDEGDA